MIEIKERGEQVIRRDVLVQKHQRNERQGKAIESLLGHGKLTIQNFEGLCPYVNRRSRQRDLMGMLDKKLIKESMRDQPIQPVIMRCRNDDKL